MNTYKNNENWKIQFADRGFNLTHVLKHPTVKICDEVESNTKVPFRLVEGGMEQAETAIDADILLWDLVSQEISGYPDGIKKETVPANHKKNVAVYFSEIAVISENNAAEINPEIICPQDFSTFHIYLKVWQPAEYVVTRHTFRQPTDEEYTRGKFLLSNKRRSVENEVVSVLNLTRIGDWCRIYDNMKPASAGYESQEHDIPPFHKMRTVMALFSNTTNQIKISAKN